MTYIDVIIENLQKAQDESNAANQKRFDEAKSLYDEIIAQFSEGGAFEQGIEAQIGTASKKSVAQARQSLVSSGLSNVSSRANLEKKFEAGVGRTMRLKGSDIRQQGLSRARTAKAGLIERVEDTGPSPTFIADLASKSGSR